MNNSNTYNSERILGIGIVDKQNGGNGQFARVEVSIAPLEDGDAPNQITNAVIGGAIPTAYLPSVLNGVRDGLNRGPLGGYPVTGVEVTITSGKSHSVDSSAQAFEEAGRLAVQDALRKSEVALLEPVAALEVTVAAPFVGAVVGDVNRRRGQITDMSAQTDGRTTIQATVPLAETFGYATDLRSMTQGSGDFTLQPSGYAEAPRSVAAAVTRK